jgi:hypothetical protein
MKQTHLGYEQKFYLNGTQLSGVQSVNGSYGIQEQPINILGWGHVGGKYYPNPDYILDQQNGFILNEEGFKMVADNPCVDVDKIYPDSLAVLSAPLEGSFSINSALVSRDMLIDFTGDNPFTGSIHYASNYFGFESGYITDHSVSCAIGQLPTTSTNIRVFGDIGGAPDFIRTEDDSNVNQETEYGMVTEDSRKEGLYNASGKNPFPEIVIPSQGSISVECFGAETDRVTAFTHSINVPIDPIYIVGSSRAIQVDVSWPITTTTSVSLDVDEYEYHSLREYLVSPNLEDVKIKINDCFGRPVHHYIVSSARLVGESMSASSEGRMTVNLEYKSYHNKR